MKYTLIHKHFLLFCATLLALKYTRTVMHSVKTCINSWFVNINTQLPPLHMNSHTQNTSIKPLNENLCKPYHTIFIIQHRTFTAKLLSIYCTLSYAYPHTFRCTTNQAQPFLWIENWMVMWYCQLFDVLTILHNVQSILKQP